MMAGIIEHHGAALTAQLEAELGVVAPDADEPALPAPRPDGILASLTDEGGDPVPSSGR